MPCNSDERNWHGHGEPREDLRIPPPNVDNVTHDNLLDKIQLREIKDKNRFLEAALCALFNELEKKDIHNEIITKASKNGKIDLLKFWENHKIKDIDRLKQDLDKYSEHEKHIIKQLLNNP